MCITFFYFYFLFSFVCLYSHYVHLCFQYLWHLCSSGLDRKPHPPLLHFFLSPSTTLNLTDGRCWNFLGRYSESLYGSVSGQSVRIATQVWRGIQESRAGEPWLVFHDRVWFVPGGGWETGWRTIALFANCSFVCVFHSFLCFSFLTFLAGPPLPTSILLFIESML